MKVGDTPSWSTVAVVVDANNNNGFTVGDKVNTVIPWRKYVEREREREREMLAALDIHAGD